jgi:hypothetical protein
VHFATNDGFLSVVEISSLGSDGITNKTHENFN